jgi:tripartite-type tricarboxylate transporter receptor subunit TctC
MAFFGLVAPDRTPPMIIETLNAALNRALETQPVRDALSRQQALPQPGTPNDFAVLIYQQFVRMRRAVVAAKIEVN